MIVISITVIVDLLLYDSTTLHGLYVWQCVCVQITFPLLIALLFYFVNFVFGIIRALFLLNLALTVSLYVYFGVYFYHC